ncbi:DNA primase [Vibrio phage D51]
MHSNVPGILERKDIAYEEKGEDYLVHCINPDHEDSHPSLRIHSQTGRFHCFSCGIKGDIFRYFGEYQSRTYDLLYEVETDINSMLIATRGLDIPLSAEAWSKDFRGISAETFDRFYAFTHTDPEFVNRVVFPISDLSGKIHGFVGRYTHSKASPKYRVVPQGAKLPIYPIPKGDSVVFVEGLFDCINLIDKGMDNACALFGTHNLSLRNIEDKLAPLQASGVVRVFMLLDRDRAGTDAAIKIKNMIESKLDMKVYDVSDFLDKGQDPGDLTKEEVDLLGRFIERTIAREA